MIKVTIEKYLDDGWINDEQAEGVTDDDLFELVMEDRVALLEGAKFVFERAAKAVGGK